MQIQWGLENRTRSEFEWSKLVRLVNGSDFECHSKSEPKFGFRMVGIQFKKFGFRMVEKQDGRQKW